MPLAAHPRLLIKPQYIDRLKHKPRLKPLVAARESTMAIADRAVKQAEPNFAITGHNAHLIRARLMQTDTISLLAAYLQTGEKRYRTAILRHIRAINAWAYWCWNTWRNGLKPHTFFDLSHGENSTTAALVFDLLHDELTDAEKNLFIDIAENRSFKAFFNTLENGAQGGPWWLGNAHSNWNAVCAGGAGLLALALREYLPRSAQVLKHVEKSLVPFYKTLVTHQGGWPEGVGYWNFGMRYGFFYLLSHENATGRKHPLLRQAATAKTLSFPLDFAPNAQPMGFGDANGWAPMPFHFETAVRLNQLHLIKPLTDCLNSDGRHVKNWPHAALLGLLHPGTLPPTPANSNQLYIKRYANLDWAVLADREHDRNFCLTIRGGKCPLPHGHMDLLSFHLMVKDEKLIHNLGAGQYLDNTFGPRRFDMFEMNPLSKNTILINGLGHALQAQANTSTFSLGKSPAVRLEISNGMGTRGYDPQAAEFCARLFVLVDDHTALIVDRIQVHKNFEAQFESRMHSLAPRVDYRDHGATIRGAKRKLTVAYAASKPATLHSGLTCPTSPPGPQAAAWVLRWCCDKLQRGVTFATLLTTEAKAPKMTVKETGQRITITVGRRRLVLNMNLRPAR